jgi:hypothetical protein
MFGGTPNRGVETSSGVACKTALNNDAQAATIAARSLKYFIVIS